jgi:hypothetical protein
MNPIEKNCISTKIDTHIFPDQSFPITRFCDQVYNVLIISRSRNLAISLVGELVSILVSQQSINNVVIFTNGYGGILNMFGEGCVFYEEYNPIILQKMIDEQKKIKNGRMLLINNNMSVPLNCQVYREIMEKGKFLGINHIMTTTYSASIPPNIRLNFDIIFLENCNNISIKKRDHELYFGIYPNYKDFSCAINSLGDNTLLVTDNEKCYHYKVCDREFNLSSIKITPYETNTNGLSIDEQIRHNNIQIIQLFDNINKHNIQIQKLQSENFQLLSDSAKKHSIHTIDG